MFCIMLSLSCGVDNSGELELSVAPEQTFFVPGDVNFEDGTGLVENRCYDDQTIEGPRYTLSTIRLVWKGEGTFEPTELRISFDGKSELISANKCSHTGPGVAGFADFLGIDDKTTDDVEKTIAQNGVAESRCSIICGSISILDEDRNFSVFAEVRVTGVQTITNADNTTTEKAVTAKKRIRISNIP